MQVMVLILHTMVYSGTRGHKMVYIRVSECFFNSKMKVMVLILHTMVYYVTRGHIMVYIRVSEFSSRETS